MQDQTLSAEKKPRFNIAIRALACLLAILMLVSTVSFTLSRVVRPKSGVVLAEAVTEAFDALANDDAYLNASAIERVRMLWASIGTKRQTAADCVRLASMYIGRGDYEEAEILYQRGVRLSADAPRSTLAELNLKLGAIKVLNGKLDEAERCFDVALANDPTSSTAYMLLAQVYVEQKEYEKAAEQLKTYLTYAPHDDQNRLLLGNLYEYCEKPELAFAQYLQLFRETKDPARHADIARAGLQSGEYKIAAEHLDYYLEDNEDADGSIHFLRGMAHIWLEQYDKAEADLTVALESGYADQAGCCNSLSLCTYAQNRYKETVDYGVQAIELWSEPDAACLQRIGLSFMQLGKYDEAMEYLAQSIAVDPSQPDNHYFMATLHFAKDDYDEAIKEYTTAINGNYLVQECTYNRAICYLRKNDIDSAVTDFGACINNGDDQTIIEAAASVLKQLIETQTQQ